MSSETSHTNKDRHTPTHTVGVSMSSSFTANVCTLDTLAVFATGDCKNLASNEIHVYEMLFLYESASQLSIQYETGDS